ncbi:hypothetical protein HGRIS_004740 [Hohenbuehelia grisea]|uniref:Ataxin-10 homolog n=1 Tax=Hohenbuehelia grisea TaxID=104357 RepID=A0ABR3JE33_9AGAR
MANSASLSVNGSASPDDQKAEINTRFLDVATKLDINIREHLVTLTSTLDALASDLAKSHGLRQRAGSSEPRIWPQLRKLWRDLARVQLTFWDGDDSDGEGEGDEERRQQSLRLLCTSLAKFTRNLAAEVPENQELAFQNEIEIRRLLHYHTSWTAVKDEQSYPVTRMLTQCLANIVTANEDLMTKLWNAYLTLSEDQVIFIRLLTSPDNRTVLSVLVLILNCIHDSKSRAKMLCKTAIGCRICVSLLDGMLKMYDAEEASEGAKAFDIGYDIFVHLIEEGLATELYTRLSVQDEIVTPHQTTLLKLIDSYLQSTQLAARVSTPKSRRIHRKLSPMLSKCFFTMAQYMQVAIRRLPGIDEPHVTGAQSGGAVIDGGPISASGSQTPAAQSQTTVQTGSEALLPKVCEALVLVTQCMSSITLEPEEREPSPPPAQDLEKSPNLTSTRNARSFASLQEYFNETRYAGQGTVECLIDLLRILEPLLPRIHFGKPVPSPGGVGPGVTTQAEVPDPTGFAYLKRDLVRLLGILCHGNRAVQDRVRVCGGIEVVMNLCVVDERNPYLREHAIFTLHNLLENNPQNQEIVDGVKPMGAWDEDGRLRDTPGSVRR